MFLNVIELAESFGVDESVVENWVRNEGLPCVPDRGRMLFDRAQVVVWAASRGLAARAGFLTGAQANTAGSEGRLAGMLRQGGIWRHVAPQALRELMANVVGGLPGTTPAIRQLLQQRVRAEGSISWAPVGGGLALPHLRTPVALGRDAGTLAMIFLDAPLTLGDPSPDDRPVTRLLFFVAPSPRAHLELLGSLSRALTRGMLRQQVMDASSDDALRHALAASEAGAVPGETS
jgi:PTS system nitrogen regulatory IIA component